MADVERCAPGSALDRIEGETYLIRGEVSAIEPGQVVLRAGDRSVLVYLDGHHNAVGYQQPAEVRARLSDATIARREEPGRRARPLFSSG